MATTDLTRMDRNDRFEAIFRSHAPAVLRYATRRDRALADDVVSETFAVVWRRLDDMPDQPLGWLLGIARRTLANQHRGERRRLALIDRLMGSQETYVADDSLGGEVRRALDGLRPADREVLLLIEWDGVDREEVAQILGCSRAQVSVRLHRARARFAAIYSEMSAPQLARGAPNASE